MTSYKRIVIPKIPGEDIIPIYVGEHSVPSGSSWGPHIRDFFLIHFCISGKGVLYNCDGEHPVSAGELFIIREGEQTTYAADKDDPWHYVWISFLGREAEIFRNGDVVRKALKLVMDKLREFIAEEQTSAYAYTALIYMLMHELYLPQNQKIDKAVEVGRFIEYNYMENINMDLLCKSFGFERSYLFRIFRTRFGVSPKEYLVRERMSHAKELLNAGNSVQQTAYMVGYRDEFNFSKAYKKFYSVPPKSAKKRKSKSDKS